MFAPTPTPLLSRFDGSARPGEMVLVLGRPGSGCTTFLKTITNHRGGYIAVEGEVNYGGIHATEMRKRFPGEVVYNQEDDVHQSTLTVAQTLDFALRTKVRRNWSISLKLRNVLLTLESNRLPPNDSQV